MKKMRSSKGFTLIELLVVIAIIGILSSVVLASLTTARSRGTAAAVQNELSSIRAQAELYYSTNGNSYAPATYGTAGVSVGCDATAGSLFGTTVNGAGTLIAGIESKGAATGCFANATIWSAAATINSVTYCVDSTGFSGTSTAAQQTSPDGTCA